MRLTLLLIFLCFTCYSCEKDVVVVSPTENSQETDSLKSSGCEVFYPPANSSPYPILIGTIEEVWDSIGCEVDAWYSISKQCYPPIIKDDLLLIGVPIESGMYEQIIWSGKINTSGTSATVKLVANYCYICANCAYQETVSVGYRAFSLKKIKTELEKNNIQTANIEINFHQKNEMFVLTW